MTKIDCATCSVDPCTTEMVTIADAMGVETAFHRHASQNPRCGFGAQGLCCRICLKGPCRIAPTGESRQLGVCGADRHTIVARHMARMMAAGAASHSDHGRHIALALKHLSEGHLADYQIRDEAKLMSVAARLGISTGGRDNAAIAGDIARISLGDFQSQDDSIPCSWLKAFLPARRVEKLAALGIMPHNIDATVALTMARTHIGCDADPANVALGGLRVAMADLDGMILATELSDILFGTPAPVTTRANLGVLKRDAVNIAVNGHNPLLSEVVCDVAAEMAEKAVAAGAPEGINIVGICCTGNEVMNRHGVPLATNYLSQELPILTGALDAMVLDVQCIMPSLPRIAECFHTQIITTMPHARISGATHIPFREEEAVAIARRIVALAIDAFGRRDNAKIHIPDLSQKATVGFGAESVTAALATVDPEDPLKPLIDAITSGAIQGVVLFGGCNNPKTEQDNSYFRIAKILAERNVLALATGCGAGALAKMGMMTSEATLEHAGEGLKAVLTAIGAAAGLDGPLPPVLHFGSCVDNSRAVALATALANRLGVDLSDLPIVVSAPECMSEKAVAIGTWAMTIGVPTHLGAVPPVTGATVVSTLLTETVRDLVGGYFLIDTDPVSAADKLYQAIQDRRAALGL
ncbi:MAG: anaerobic carbon-monoxide dehydrogenase catalytic subunit [Telmatospirillum sp.]|nr:anaerobic carbon-monoxide dehydrogenase catalytic subunit [Telmatospirillum sp.]